MTRKQVLADSVLSLLLFFLLILVSSQIGRLVIGRQASDFQAEPIITLETVDYLVAQVRRPTGLGALFQSRDLATLDWLVGPTTGSQLALAMILAACFFLIVWLIRSFRSSYRRRRIELVAEHTLEASFILTTIGISLSPFLAWAYQRWLFPDWRLSLNRDHLLAILYPIMINELVLILGLTTLLAGLLVGLLLFLDPMK